MIKKIWNKIFGKPKEPISFKQGFDLTDLPIITLYQKDKKFNFILDTGANDSVIDASILKDMYYEPLELETHFFGVEGDKKGAQLCKIILSYKDVEYINDYVISDMSKPFGHIKKETGVTLHGLLGSKFFNKYKYVLDFDALIAYSKA